ncbi:UNVERIFIED_CONTAM: hypothetical protein NCL1_37957 [Trichonephila clavipes]
MLRFVENCRHPDKRVTNHLFLNWMQQKSYILFTYHIYKTKLSFVAVEPSSEWTKDCVVQCKYCKQYLYPQALKKHIVDVTYSYFGLPRSERPSLTNEAATVKKGKALILIDRRIIIQIFIIDINRS